jgi:hypothetical protein
LAASPRLDGGVNPRQNFNESVAENNKMSHWG